MSLFAVVVYRGLLLLVAVVEKNLFSLLSFELSSWLSFVGCWCCGVVVLFGVRCLRLFDVCFCLFVGGVCWCWTLLLWLLFADVVCHCFCCRCSLLLLCVFFFFVVVSCGCALVLYVVRGSLLLLCGCWCRRGCCMLFVVCCAWLFVVAVGVVCRCWCWLFVLVVGVAGVV